jgi:enterochelin esterase-like enzyme
VGALVTAGATTAQQNVAPKAKIADGSFRSRALRATLHYAVYLPRGYSGSGRHYPVVYYLHGLPADDGTYRNIAWLAHALEQSGHEAIVIGAQGARGSDTDPEWHDWGGGRNWETATARELVSEVDRHYRTIPARSGRALIGVSAGGYGAALIGYHHPGTFSVIQSWSGYFQPTNPAGTAVIDLGSKRANDWASLHAIVPKIRKLLGRYYTSTYFGFFIGTGDTRFLPDNKRLGREMHDARVPNYAFRIYKGDHSMDLWTEEAPAWIGRALGATAQAG